VTEPENPSALANRVYDLEEALRRLRRINHAGRCPDKYGACVCGLVQEQAQIDSRLHPRWDYQQWLDYQIQQTRYQYWYDLIHSCWYHAEAKIPPEDLWAQGYRLRLLGQALCRLARFYTMHPEYRDMEASTLAAFRAQAAADRLAPAPPIVESTPDDRE
jgi:hypothetical protein